MPSEQRTTPPSPINRSGPASAAAGTLPCQPAIVTIGSPTPCALGAQRYTPGMGNAMDVGSRVSVRLHNGYTDRGTVVRVFKNGVRRVREDRGGTHNRAPADLTPLKRCGGSCLTCAEACTHESET